MNKTELIAAVAEKANLTKASAEAAVNAVLDTITGTLADGGDVTLTGFGSFKASKRAARIGRNPQTGAAIKIPASTVVKFTVGKGLKDAVK